MFAAPAAMTFLDASALLVHEIFRLIKADFRFVSIRRRIGRDVAAVFSYDPTMGESLARLERGWTFLHHPGFHDAAVPQ